HVALDDSHVPTEFYEGMRDKKPEWTAKYKDGKFIPFWFKLADIRPVDWDRIADLESLYPNASETVPFNPMDRLSPLKVFERIPRRFFDRVPESKQGWKQILTDDFWEPGQFKSALIRKVYGDALRYASLKVPVLILGERGTGKTRLAWWIRLNSAYKQLGDDMKRWPQVACGRFRKSSLLQSELFGHKRGAFTGADSDREGIISQVNGDTLFLDEIGDIDRDSQRELIKALEEKTFCKVGSTTPQSSDFRLIAATNRPPIELAGRLDPDFLDRISDVVLTMPALRDVREDIPWLWKRTFEKAKTDLQAPALTRDVEEHEHNQLIELLTNHHLPGNFRDLRRLAVHVIGRLTAPKPELFPLEEIFREALAWHDAATPSRPEGVSRRVAAAFAADTGLVGCGPWDFPLDLEQIAKDLDVEIKHWLGSEVRRIAEARGRPEKDICRKPGKRQLQNWRKSLKKKG
ncbi:MAG: sigma 54-interacting transcriptional regulator, partial [Pseudomonadota bacterium]